MTAKKSSKDTRNKWERNNTLQIGGQQFGVPADWVATSIPSAHLNPRDFGIGNRSAGLACPDFAIGMLSHEKTARHWCFRPAIATCFTTS
jgi:hypothetical protein